MSSVAKTITAYRASFLAALLVASFGSIASAQQRAGTISLAMTETPLREVMNMLSQQERINILMSDEVDTEVSFNIFDLTVDEAIEAIANVAGYAVERRGQNYFIIDRDDAGRYATSNLTQVRTFQLQYADADELETMLSPYLSEIGQLSILAERKLLTIEDSPDFLARFERIIQEIDREPNQILIEARILEVTLNDEDSYGLDWSKLFQSDGGTGSFGTQGLADDASPGLFFDYTTPDIVATLNALSAQGRVRTLSTPKLLALENQESSVIIGDRRGFAGHDNGQSSHARKPSNSSSQASFCESRRQVDPDGNIMLDIHPEVSTGNVDANSAFRHK